MYTLIEEIDSAASHQPQSSQPQSIEAYKMMMQGRRPDIPSQNNRDVANHYNYRNSPPPPQYYQEPPRKTAIEEVITAPPKREIKEEVPNKDSTTSAIGNEVIADYIKNLIINTKETYKYFNEREHKFMKKIDMLEQLVKGIGILLVIVILILLVRK